MKTYLGAAKEETGKAPACTGALLEIKKITVGEVKSEKSEYRGCKQYTVMLAIKQPASAAGQTVFDRIRVGTVEDKDAREEKTWQVSEGGPARLRRLLTRAGVPIPKKSEDDEEWMEAAVGYTVVAPITHSGDFVNVGLYYREADKDCPVIGLADGAKGGKGVARRPAPVEAAEDDDDAPTPKKAKVSKPEPDDTEPADDDDEDEDEKPAKPAKAAKAKKPPIEDPDDDEDDD